MGKIAKIKQLFNFKETIEPSNTFSSNELLLSMEYIEGQIFTEWSAIRQIYSPLPQKMRGIFIEKTN